MKAPPEPPLGRRLVWLAGLWLGGVAAVALTAFLLRLLL